MTKHEFISKQKALRENANRRLRWWFPVFFGVVIANIPVTRYIERHEETSWAGPALGISLFAFLIGNLVLIVWFGRRQQKRFGLRCPNCGKPLIGTGVQVAVGSGNCGFCGERVFDEMPDA